MTSGGGGFASVLGFDEQPFRIATYSDKPLFQRLNELGVLEKGSRNLASKKNSLARLNAEKRRQVNKGQGQKLSELRKKGVLIKGSLSDCIMWCEESPGSR